MSHKEENSIINREEIFTAIQRSGYLLEQRVAGTMRKNKFGVGYDTRFTDHKAGVKTLREFDILAFDSEMLHKYLKREHHSGFVGIELICECKNNHQPLVFFKNEDVFADMLDHWIQIEGYPQRIITNPKSDPVEYKYLLDVLDMEDHHYLKYPFATQYCSFSKSKGGKEWLAGHQNEHHEAIEDILKATMFKRSQNEFRYNWQYGNTCLTFYHPVIILQGDMYLYQASKGKRPDKMTVCDQVTFIREMMIGETVREYAIDIIKEKNLPKYLAQLKRKLVNVARQVSKIEFYDESVQRAVTDLKIAAHTTHY